MSLQFLRMILVHAIHYPNHKTTNIFQVPEVPQEVVPEKKVPKVPSKKPEVPPVTGTC